MNKKQTILYILTAFFIIFIMGLSASILTITSFKIGTQFITTETQKELDVMKETFNQYAELTERMFVEYLPKNDYCIRECQQPSDMRAEECRIQCLKDLGK